MATPVQELKLNSANLFELVGWQDQTTLLYPADAIVRATLYDSTGAAVPGAIALALIYVAGSIGAATTYRVQILPGNVALVLGNRYTLVVTATDSAGNPEELTAPCIVTKA